jgi:hypothetical protein
MRTVNKARSQLILLHDIVVTIIVCLAVGHAAASVALFLLSLPLAAAGLELTRLYWVICQGGVGLLLAILAFSLHPSPTKQTVTWRR